MTDRFVILPGTTPPVGNAGAKKPTTAQSLKGPSFDHVLNQQLKGKTVSFSHHAQQRMQQRGIEFNAEQMTRLQDAVSQVDAKGGKDSLVMLDETALVVSVKNSTVVTVADKQQLKQNVFTKIDSAVIA